MRHAQRYPGRARGLALYSTTLRYDGWTIPKLSFLLPLILKTPYFGKRYRFEEAFPYGIMDDKLRGRILAQMQSGDAAAAGFTATPGASLKQLWGLVAAVKRDLPSIKTPTLIVHAGNDDIASARSNALYVRDHIGGPTELLLLDRSYHMVTIDQERNVVGDATARFAWNLLSDAERERLAAVAREPVPAAPETSAQTPDAAAPSPASSVAEGMEKAAGRGRGDDRADRLPVDRQHARGHGRAAFLKAAAASIPPGRAASRTGSAWLPGLGCGSASAATCSSFSCGWRSFRRLSFPWASCSARSTSW